MFRKLFFISILSLFSEHLDTFVEGAEHEESSDKSTPNPNQMWEIPNHRLLSFPYAIHLAKIEEEFSNYMMTYEVILKNRLTIVSSYLKDYRGSTIKGTAHLDDPKSKDPLLKATAVASHPLMYYRLMKRFSNQIMELKIQFANNVEIGLLQRIAKLTGAIPWPTVVDQEEATLALLRLQYVYDMDVKQLITGKIAGIQTPLELKPEEAFNIAQYASNVNFHTLAIDWIHATTWKMKSGPQNELISSDKISKAVQDVISKHNTQLEQTNYTGTMFTYISNITTIDLPPTKRSKDNATFSRSRPLNPQHYLNRSEEELIQRAQMDYITLCNGHLLQSKLVKSQLHCYYDNKRHPYWLINPLKTEVLNFEPLLVQVYEFIGDKAINQILLKTVEYSQSPVDLSHYISPGNVVYAWLNDSDVPETKLSNKIELYTRLKAISSLASAPLQVATHTVGSHEALHVDFMSNIADPQGDRIATFMVHLNNVDKGGFTVFPILGTFIRPVKGSAVFWLNSYRNGNVDTRMIHGICPPILGYQWIARKWIYQHSNFLQMPCNLSVVV